MLTGEATHYPPGLVGSETRCVATTRRSLVQDDVALRARERHVELCFSNRIVGLVIQVFILEKSSSSATYYQVTPECTKYTTQVLFIS